MLPLFGMDGGLSKRNILLAQCMTALFAAIAFLTTGTLGTTAQTVAIAQKKNHQCQKQPKRGTAVPDRRTSMRITLDIPDGVICGFFNGVEHTNTGLQLVSYQLSSDDFTDGNTVKLPRERKEGADNR